MLTTYAEPPASLEGLPHLCTVCGRAGVWTETWSRYGTEEEIEAICCGQPCRIAFEACGRKLPVPDDVLRAIWRKQASTIYGRPTAGEPDLGGGRGA